MTIRPSRKTRTRKLAAARARARHRPAGQVDARLAARRRRAWRRSTAATHRNGKRVAVKMLHAEF